MLPQNPDNTAAATTSPSSNGHGHATTVAPSFDATAAPTPSNGTIAPPVAPANGAARNAAAVGMTQGQRDAGFSSPSAMPNGRIDRCRMWLTCGNADPRVRVRPLIDALLNEGFRRGDGSANHLVLWADGATLWLRYVPATDSSGTASVIVDVWGFDIGATLAGFIAGDLANDSSTDLRIDLQSNAGLRTISLTNGLDYQRPTSAQGHLS